MFNNTDSLIFLKNGIELQDDIHKSLEQTFDLIFKDKNSGRHIARESITSKTNPELAIYKYYAMHNSYNKLFDKKWLEKVFILSEEAPNIEEDYSAFYHLIPGAKSDIVVTKTLIIKLRISLRIFFYALYCNRSILLPTIYRFPKKIKNNVHTESAMPLYSELLILFRNPFLNKDPTYPDISHHFEGFSKSNLKDEAYKIFIAMNWYEIEDVNVEDAVNALALFLIYEEDHQNKKAFFPIVSVMYILAYYAPHRCSYTVEELREKLPHTGYKKNEIVNIEYERLKINHIKNEAFNDKFNLSDSIVFLLEKNELSKAVAIAFQDTLSFIEDHSKLTHPFVKIFKEYIKVENFYDKDKLNDVFNVCISKDNVKAPIAEKIIPKELLIDFPINENKAASCIIAFRVFMYSLYAHRAVLLTTTFPLISISGKDPLLEIYPEILKIFSNTTKNRDDRFPILDETIRETGFLKEGCIRALVATKWYEIKDITIEDAKYYCHQNHILTKISDAPKRSLPVFKILSALHDYDPKSCKFDRNELAQLLKVNSKIASGSAYENTLSVVNPELSKNWVYYQEKYVSLRKARGFKTFDKIKPSLNILNEYIFIVLPDAIPESEIPYRPADFTRRFLAGNKATPSLLDHVKKNHSSDAEKNHLINIRLFFEWLEYQQDEEDVCGFKNNFHMFDLPIVSGSRGTNKKIFPAKVFPFVHSFIYALCDFYWYVISNKKTEDKVHFNKNICYNTEEMGYVPIVLINRKLYPIKYIPKSLMDYVETSSNGKPLVYPTMQALYAIAIGLDTGIRNIHIRWLSLDKYQNSLTGNDVIDQLHVNNIEPSESDFLEVSTDKVKRKAWTPYVSSRVFRLLNRLKTFAEISDVEVPALWYDGHEDSPFGKIRSLFCTLDVLEPDDPVISGASCRKQYMKTQLFFDLFVKINQIEITPLNKMPKKISNAILDLTNEEEILVAAFSCSNSYKTDYTPHGSRSSVASERVKVLPPHVVAEYITGHESLAVLAHYVQLDAEYIKELSRDNADSLLTDLSNNNLSIGNSVTLKSQEVHAALRNAVEKDPSLIETHFGGVSFSTEVKGRIEGGLSRLYTSPLSNIALMSTHICPFNAECPDDIKKEFGNRMCGQCYYSIKTVDHIPRILAEIRKLNAEKNEKSEQVTLAIKSEVDEEAIESLDNQKIAIANELSAWVFTYEILRDKHKELIEKDANEKEFFLVAKPQIIIKRLRENSIPNKETSELLLRIEDADMYHEYFTPQLKGKLTVIRNKLIIHSKQFDKLLEESDGYDILDEVRGLLRSVSMSEGISSNEVLERLSKPLSALPNNPKLGYYND
jgi:hypothetical protein